MFPKDYRVLLVVSGVAALLFWPLFSLLRQHRWKNFVYALRLCDPEMYAALAASWISFLQKLDDRNPLSNDRLWKFICPDPLVKQLPGITGHRHPRLPMTNDE